MEIFLDYLKVFFVGGTVCFIGQILINTTKMTSARILVMFLSLGVLLQATGVYKIIENFGGAGISVPIIGFGAGIAKGAMEGAKTGILEAIAGGLASVSPGLTAAIFFGFVFALIFKSQTKKCE